MSEVLDRVRSGECPRCGSPQFAVTERLIAATGVDLRQPWMTTPGVPEVQSLDVECARCHQVFRT